MFQQQLIRSRSLLSDVTKMECSSDNASFDLQYSCFKSTSEAERQKILEDRNSSSTNKATKHMLRILEEYIIEREVPKLEDTTDDQLPHLLECFYTELRQQDGSMYKLAILKCIHTGLNHHFKDTRNLDIISDIRFTKANQMFKGVAVQTRKAGLGSTKSFPVIPDKDMERLGDYFYQDFNKEVNPKKLQQAVIYTLIYFTCRRGRENLYDMTPNTY